MSHYLNTAMNDIASSNPLEIKSVNIVMKAVEGLTAIAKLGTEAEASRLKFEALLGSSQKANKMIGDLQEFANATPLESKGLQENAELLLSFGLESEKVLPSLKMLGNLTGGNQEKMNSMAEAFSRVSSKGRLLEQDLNLMSKSGFNPLKTISENTGISLDTLRSKMEQGKISVGMIEESFRLATSNGGKFHGILTKISQTGSGKLSTAISLVKTQATNFGMKYMSPLIGTVAEFIMKFVDGLLKIGPHFEPVLNALGSLWSSVSKFVKNLFGIEDGADSAESSLGGLETIVQYLSTALEVVIQGISGFITLIRPIAPLLKILIIGYSGLVAIQWALNIVSKANSFHLIIALIIGLIGVVMVIWNRFEKFRGCIIGVWEVLKGFGKMIKDYVITRFKELLSGITGIGRALLAFFKGDWSEAWEVGKQAGKDLIGVNSAKEAIASGANIAENFRKGYDKGIKMKPLSIKSTTDQTSQKTAQEKSDIFDSLLEENTEIRNRKENSLKKGADTVISGGKKQTHIDIRIHKLQDDTKIFVSSAEQGLDDLGDKVQEILLRAINSVNQIQTT